ncbi:MAG: NADP-dependent oxidoreductase [Chloroflexota bacterium]
MSTISKEIHLKSRPVGLPTLDNFEVAEVTLPDPGDGEILIRNVYMSVDPYMRGRMVDRRSYTPPFQLGEPLTGGAVGRVVASNNEKFAVGDTVLHMYGWREYAISNGKGVDKIDPSIGPLQSFLGTLGMPGMTAYVGLMNIGAPKEGETVFVSAASGAVGAIVCQIAKAQGCRVVGSVGSDEKVQWLLDEAGADAVFNYKTVSSVHDALKDHCPDGVDIYFENVGGEHLEAALTHMNNYGRIPVCGMIAQYNATAPVPGPNNMAAIIGKRLKLQGFIVSDHYDQLAEFYGNMSQWIANGQLKWKETILDGVERAPEAFIMLFTGENFGKMLVKIGEE